MAAMATLIITEKSSQAKDLRAALGERYGRILPAEGHLLRLAEPDEVDPAWKRWSPTLLKPDGLYPTRPDQGGNKAAKLQAITAALRAASTEMPWLSAACGFSPTMRKARPAGVR